MIGAWIVAAALLGNGVVWEKDFDAAFAKAKERNVPVLVCFNMDGESANDSLVKIYKDPEFVKRSADFVCLVASTFAHSPAGSSDPCSRFGTITCDDHRTVEKKARAAFIGKEEVIAPQHVLATPDKKVLVRRAYEVDKATLLKMMTMAHNAMRTGADVKADAAQESAGDSIRGGAPTAEHIAELIAAAKDHNAERRKPAIAELGQLDDVRARDALIALLDPRVMDDTRCDAIDALASKGNYDALAPIVARLSDSNTTVLHGAVLGLGRIGLPAATPALLKLTKKKLVTMVACDIPRALAECDPKSAEVQAFVKKASLDKDQGIAAGGLRALRSLKPDAETKKILETRLTDSSASVRGVAVWVVGTTRERALEAKLKGMLDRETNDHVRECIAAALKNLGAGDGSPCDPELDGMLWRFTSMY